jgi:hypothetical protein
MGGFCSDGKVFIGMKNIQLRASLRIVLRPHLENLNNIKHAVSGETFEKHLEETKRKFSKDPQKYFIGIENNHHNAMIIESVFDELLE